MKILLVDDDRDFCMLTQKLLTIKGYDTFVAHDGKTAKEQAKKVKPNIILMDMMLPDVTGPEIIREFQDENDLKNIPVLFMTGLVSGNDKSLDQEGVRAGGQKYPAIGKPYDTENLLSMIRKLAR